MHGPDGPMDSSLNFRKSLSRRIAKSSSWTTEFENRQNSEPFVSREENALEKNHMHGWG